MKSGFNSLSSHGGFPNLKTKAIIVLTAISIGGFLGWKKSHPTARNQQQQEVVSHDEYGNIQDYYDTRLATLQAPYNIPSTHNAIDQIVIPDSLPIALHDTVIQACTLPYLPGKRLPLPIDLTGAAFATTHTDKRDIAIPDYTATIGTQKMSNISVYCATGVRQFLQLHLLAGAGGIESITPTAKNFFLKEGPLYTTIATKSLTPNKRKQDGSTRYMNKGIVESSSGYTHQSSEQLTRIQSGDIIFVIFGNSSSKVHDYDQTYPSTHVMVGLGTHSIKLDKLMFKGIDIADHDEVLRTLCNHRIDNGHQTLSKEQFQKNKRHLLSQFPKLTLPTVEVQGDSIIITGDRIRDLLPNGGVEKARFRLSFERFIQSSSKAGQNGFMYNPLTTNGGVYRLTDPSLLFKDTTPYITSRNMASHLQPKGFIIPNEGDDLDNQIYQSTDSISGLRTTKTHEYFGTLAKKGIPFTIIDSILPQGQELLRIQALRNLPLQQEKQSQAIATFNLTQINNYKNNPSDQSGRSIIPVSVGDKWVRSLRNRIGEELQHYHTSGPQLPLVFSREEYNESQRQQLFSLLPRIGIINHRNELRTSYFGDEQIQAGEHIVLHIPSIYKILTRQEEYKGLSRLASIPTEYFVLDETVQTIIGHIARDREDMKGILSGIATSETPGKHRSEIAYKRKTGKYIGEHQSWMIHLLGKNISSQGLYQMRAKNYTREQYIQTIDYLTLPSTQQRLQQQTKFTGSWNDYRQDHEGDDIEAMKALLQDLSFDLSDNHNNTYSIEKKKEFINLFNHLIQIQDHYDKDDIIGLTFATKLVMTDLIDKKDLLIKQIGSAITPGHVDESLAQDYLQRHHPERDNNQRNHELQLWKNQRNQQNSITITKMIQDPQQRRSLDELTRAMHNLGPRALYQKLIIIYLSEVIHTFEIDHNDDGTIRSLTTFDPKLSNKSIYQQQIQEIVKKIQLHKATDGNPDLSHHMARQIFASLPKNPDGSIQTSFLQGEVNSFASLEQVINLVTINCKNHNYTIPSILPAPEALYNHPLFHNYLTRADVDKSEESKRLWSIGISSGLALGIIIYSIIVQVRKGLKRVANAEVGQHVPTELQESNP